MPGPRAHVRSCPRYAEGAAPADLAAPVASVWTLEVGADSPHVQRVLPDGCIDLIDLPGAGIVVAGPSTRAFLSTVPADSTVVGVRFRPGVAPSVLGVPAHALRDRSPRLEDVWSRSDRHRVERARASGTVPERLAALLDLVRATRPRWGSPDPLVRAAIARLDLRSETPVAALAAELGLSERQLRRRFDDAVGYGPKRLARIMRLRRTLAGARGRPDVGWLEHALDGGYVDHAHLVRECRTLTGLTPTALQPRPAQMSVPSQRHAVRARTLRP